MSKVADSIKRGLQEAISIARGKAVASIYRVHSPNRVKDKNKKDRIKRAQYT